MYLYLKSILRTQGHRFQLALQVRLEPGLAARLRHQFYLAVRHSE
jgi:hypothetical protein